MERIQKKIERKIYKTLCMTIKAFYFQKKMKQFYDLIAKIYFINQSNRDMWELWPELQKNYEYAETIERNQFTILLKIVNSSVLYDELVKEIKIISNRYKRSETLRKQIYKDD